VEKITLETERPSDVDIEIVDSDDAESSDDLANFKI